MPGLDENPKVKFSGGTALAGAWVNLVGWIMFRIRKMLIVLTANNLFANDRNRFRPDISQLSRAGTGKSPIMKSLFCKQNTTVAALGLGLLVAQYASGQTNLQFTAVAATDEKAIRLTWASTNGEVYEIDEADALIDTNTGSTIWKKLYDNYPSQGTNTFWLDTGNYNIAPQILHPKNMPMRFYRILDLGADTTSDEPTVSITSPTNGSAVTGELTINVVASTDQPVLSGTKLYVDGQEMQMADSRTNYSDSSTNYEVDTYSINTCEWGNGTHTLFATVECASGYGDAINASPVLLGHAVSVFVPITINNLVTRISFSQPFFDPSVGQTQQVSAVFAANANWTLNIVDAVSNVVLTTTGSGTSMQYNWDGTGTGGTNLPTGIYYYLISAQTNGLAPQSLISENLSSASMSSPGLQPMELFAVPTDGSGAPVPLAIYPQGFDINNLTIFSATQAEIDSLYSEDSEPEVALNSGVSLATDSGGGDAASPNGSPAPSPQPAPPSPQRPPNGPAKGVTGIFGVAYQEYKGGISLASPLNGLSQLHVYIQGSTANVGCPFIESVSINYFIA